MSEKEIAPSKAEAYAKAMHTLREVRKDTLATLGYTEKSLKELEAEVLEIVAARELKFISTPHGILQLIPDSKITWSPLHAHSNPESFTRRQRLAFISKEDK